MESKVILITGGAGFIGSNVYRQIVDNNQVLIFDRVQNNMPENIGSNFILGDVSNFNDLEKIKGGVDIILHFGSYPSIISYQTGMIEKAVESFKGFMNILEFGKKKNIEKLIYPSSGTVYGGISNNSQFQLSPKNIYGEMKLIHESLANYYKDNFKSNGLRIFMGYGPGEEKKEDIASPVYLFLSKMMKGENPVVWGNGNQSRDLVYIDDIVELISILIKKDVNLSHIDVGSGVNTTFNEIISIINDVLETQIKAEYVQKPENYLEVTKADPTDFMKILGRNLIDPKKGIEKFRDYLE